MEAWLTLSHYVSETGPFEFGRYFLKKVFAQRCVKAEAQNLLSQAGN